MALGGKLYSGVKPKPSLPVAPPPCTHPRPSASRCGRQEAETPVRRSTAARHGRCTVPRPVRPPAPVVHEPSRCHLRARGTYLDPWRFANGALDVAKCPADLLEGPCIATLRTLRHGAPGAPVARWAGVDVGPWSLVNSGACAAPSKYNGGRPIGTSRKSNSGAIGRAVSLEPYIPVYISVLII